MSSTTRINRDTAPQPDRESKKQYICSRCRYETRMLPWDADDTVRIGCSNCGRITRHVRKGSVPSCLLAMQDGDTYVR